MKIKFNFTCINRKCRKRIDGKCSVWKTPDKNLCKDFESSITRIASVTTGAMFFAKSAFAQAAEFEKNMAKINMGVQAGKSFEQQLYNDLKSKFPAEWLKQKAHDDQVDAMAGGFINYAQAELKAAARFYVPKGAEISQIWFDEVEEFKVKDKEKLAKLKREAAELEVKIAEDEKKNEKKLFLKLNKGAVDVVYGNQNWGCDVATLYRDGEFSALSSNTMLENYEAWVEGGEKIDTTPVEFKGRAYWLNRDHQRQVRLVSAPASYTQVVEAISPYCTMRVRKLDIPMGIAGVDKIYNFSRAYPECNCGDPNIITTKRGRRVVIF